MRLCSWSLNSPSLGSGRPTRHRQPKSEERYIIKALWIRLSDIVFGSILAAAGDKTHIIVERYDFYCCCSLSVPTQCLLNSYSVATATDKTES